MNIKMKIQMSKKRAAIICVALFAIAIISVAGAQVFIQRSLQGSIKVNSRMLEIYGTTAFATPLSTLPSFSDAFQDEVNSLTQSITIYVKNVDSVASSTHTIGVNASVVTTGLPAGASITVVGSRADGDIPSQNVNLLTSTPSGMQLVNPLGTEGTATPTKTYCSVVITLVGMTTTNSGTFTYTLNINGQILTGSGST